MSDVTDLKAEVLLLRMENAELRRTASTETEALERRIDELCQENERLHADQAHWELGNCPNCPNVVNLQEALEQNSKLCAEVERLRKAKDTMHGDAFEIGAMLVKARHENVKLRELVDELYPLADYGAMDESELDRAHDLMRDAGIEVPE